jgi:hypothetical protein
MISSTCKFLLPFPEFVFCPCHSHSLVDFANFLFRSDEDFIEPPSKKAKSGAVLPNPAASEASAPAAAPTAQMSTASSLSKGKDVPSAAAAPSSGKPVSLLLQALPE